MAARKPYVDALRGFAVVLMVVNHTARWWLDPTAGPARERLIYVTMALAGPIFLFLVGFSLALAYHGALARGDPFRAIVAGNLRRTVLIGAIAVLLNVVVFPHDVLGARVLHSIALAIAAVTPLLPLVRVRAGRAGLLGAAILLHALVPLALPALTAWSAAHPVPAALLLREFPLFPWLGLVLVGLVWGWNDARGARREDRWAVAGFLGVVGYLLADWRTPLAARLTFGRDVELNGYWTAAPLTALGIAGAILVLVALAARVGGRSGWLVRLGRTALLLYVVHLVVVLPLGREAWGFGWSAWWAYGVATVALLVGLTGLAVLWLHLRPRLAIRGLEARRRLRRPAGAPAP